MNAAAPDRRARRDRAAAVAYQIGIWLKGIDGLVELIAGLLLWLAPSVLRGALAPLIATDADDRAVRLLVADWAGRLDTGIAAGPSHVVIIFLLTHGIIKIVLAYCLIRGFHWVYPYAIAILGLFTLYQLYAVIRTPSVGGIVFLAIDVAIVWLIWRESRLKRSTAEEGRVAQ